LESAAHPAFGIYAGYSRFHALARKPELSLG